MKLLTYLTIIVLSICCIACQGGGTTPEPEPAKSTILAVHNTSVLRVYGPPGTADPGTLAEVISPYPDQVAVDEDGGFKMTIDLPQLAKPTLQVANEVTLNYVVGGITQYAKAPVSLLSARVTAPLFSTGAGPNDMVFGDDSLYVANSLDNTVVRYGLDGELLATAAFPEYASPSGLCLFGNQLWVATNGDNTLSAWDALDLSSSSPAASLLPAELTSLAFPGAGYLACGDSSIFVPFAMIESFGDSTSYAPGAAYAYNSSGPSADAATRYDLSAADAISCAYDSTNQRLLVVTAGEVQFDADFHPFVTSDSYLDIFPAPGAPAAIDLGAIGAGRIAVSADGSTAYLGNALNGNLYKVDLDTMTVLRGQDNPIVLTTEFTYISDVAYTPDGKYVLATSFNTDELYVIDAATDEVNPGPYPGPFDLSLDPELLGGCANVEIDPTPRGDGSYTAYVLYGVANAVAKVELF